MLIKCSECRKEISDKADFCPSCGNPIRNKIVNLVESNKKVEIELTNKKWKKQFLIGMAIFIIGWAIIFKVPVLGWFLMFIGFIAVISASIGRWWTNG